MSAERESLFSDAETQAEAALVGLVADNTLLNVDDLDEDTVEFLKAASALARKVLDRG